jgi:hypothetical protein
MLRACGIAKVIREGRRAEKLYILPMNGAPAEIPANVPGESNKEFHERRITACPTR